MKSATPIDQLITSIARLPGLGSRSARRITLHLLRKREQVLTPLIHQMQQVSEAIQTCSICRNLDISDPCSICQDSSRVRTQICVVEDIADLWALERSGLYRGTYHILGGVLSAIDGMGPEQLGVHQLMERVKQHKVEEIILATNATADGQTTAHYLSDQLQEIEGLQISRLAQGIPMGGELDYLDDGTLGAAFQARLKL